MYEPNSTLGPVIVMFFLTFLAIFLFVAFAIWIATVVGKWQVFKKAGKPGWAAIIPFYDMWVLYEISGIKPIYMIFTVIGTLLTTIGNVMNSFGQSKEITGLVIASIPVNLISIVFSLTGLVFSIMASLNLAKCFNKSQGYGIGLAFLSFIFYPMLGFSKTAEYHKLEK